MIRGIDVSSVQGEIDWGAARDALGLRFAIIKCTTGNAGWPTPKPDPRFAANVAGARAAGLVVGAYHFAFPLPGSPAHPGRTVEDQVQLAHALSGGLGEQDGDLPPALDLEWPEPDKWQEWGCTAVQIRQWCADAVGVWAQAFGCQPLVYTYPDWWMHVGGASEPSFASAPLWMAQYTHDQTTWPEDGVAPLIVGPWTSWAAWQWSGGGVRLPSGAPVDGDVIADDATLKGLTG